MTTVPIGFFPKAVLFITLAIGVTAFIKLFLPVRESARDLSRPVSKKEARKDFIGGLVVGGWFIFWGSGAASAGKFGLEKYSGQTITPADHPFYFWATIGTVVLLGFCFIAHTLRKALRNRRRASILKHVSYLQ